MAEDFAKGDGLGRNRGTGTGARKAAKRYTSFVSKAIEGAEITRNATEHEAACPIESGADLERT